MKLNKTDRTRRTDAFLKNWHGNPREWDHLHGVLCLSHGWTTGESVEFSKIINTTMIAERLDELTNIALGRVKAIDKHLEKFDVPQ